MQQGDLHGPAVAALCVRAGFSKEEAKLIAWASWMTDESSITQVKWPWQLLWNNPGPIYHFVAGATGIVWAGGPISKRLVGEATNPFELGIALHAFMDSYSHAGFVGRLDKRNVIKLGRGYWFLPPYGHTQLYKIPDRCECVWTDTRTGEIRRNGNIFAKALYEVYRLIMKPDSPLPASDITNLPILEPNYDKRKAEWARLAGMPDIRFSQIKTEYWRKYKKEFKAAAKRQREFLQ